MSPAPTDHRVVAPPSALADAIAALEADHDCTVVAARDVGSRAWGLSHPGSDYDVTVLFRQPLVHYATLGEYVPTVHYDTADVEVTAWNVRRFGELLVDSNPATLEFLHSPLRYRTCDPLAALETDVGSEFEPIRLYHHYRSFADRQFRKYCQRRLLRDGEPAYLVVGETDEEWVCAPDDGEGLAAPPSRGRTRIPKDDDRYELGEWDPTVDRTTYLVRAALYARFVRDTHEFPTLDFPAFLDECDSTDRLDDDVLDRARLLVERKRAGRGDESVPDLFTDGSLALPAEIPPAEHAVRGIDAGRVNEFLEAVFEAD
ncbi:DNA polymerase beta superfamily protein [Haloarchaeobius baliensis]|uniref:DNA polymerase beta superfamily protein n=1 Tax=Haloarchaeobius baliensis TaxID=1670458 RepID=UPI003F883B5D